MLTPLRWLGTALAVAVLSGCGMYSIWNEVPARQPEFTPAPTTAAPDDRTAHPYTGELGEDAECVKASKAVLADMELAAQVGGAITYPQGVLVKSNEPWWTVVVATAVHANNSGFTRDNVAEYAFFATSSPYYEPEDWETAGVTWSVTDSTESARMALACLKKLPAVKPDPEPKSPVDSYTGRLAPKATCRGVSAELLAKLEQVGRVGGAITYPSGRMVRANKSWWTVAVATKVHPNGEGYTSDNVPATALFVTDAPSLRGSERAGAHYFPIKGKRDAAAAKALACLRG